MAAEREKSRVLVVGATGRLGRELARATLTAGHPTAALVRASAFSHPDKSSLLRSLSAAGATLLKGSLDDFPSLLEAVEQVDVVICAVPSKLVLEQKPLIHAIKSVGQIKKKNGRNVQCRIRSTMTPHPLSAPQLTMMLVNRWWDPLVLNTSLYPSLLNESKYPSHLSPRRRACPLDQYASNAQQ